MQVLILAAATLLATGVAVAQRAPAGPAIRPGAGVGQTVRFDIAQPSRPTRDGDESGYSYCDETGCGEIGCWESEWEDMSLCVDRLAPDSSPEP